MGCRAMDQTFLLALALALVVALGALGRLVTRPQAAMKAAGDGGFVASTEGMKICPKCSMGNLWTERTCINCRTKLKG